MVHSRLVSNSLITCDVNAESWSMDNLVGGRLNNIHDVITHLRLFHFAYFAWESHEQSSSFHKLQ